MADLNSCSFTGRLGRDVETRQTQGGGPVSGFPLAVGRKTKNGDETLWIRCSVFGKRGEIASQYLSKGSQVAVTGRLVVRDYKDRDGVDRQSIELVVGDFTMLGSPKDSPRNTQTQTQSEDAPAPDFDDDIPF